MKLFLFRKSLQNYKKSALIFEVFFKFTLITALLSIVGCGSAFQSSYNLDSNFYDPEEISSAGAQSSEGAVAYDGPVGVIDSSFGTNGFATHGGANNGLALGNANTIQDDNKILVVGYTRAASGPSDYDMAVWRYNPDGSIDSTFAGGSGLFTFDIANGYQIAEDIIVQSDGKILVCGYHLNTGDSSFYMTVLRLTSSGVLDSTFGSGAGYVTHTTNGKGFSIDFQSDGKIIVGGNLNNQLFSVWRLNQDGSLDTSFAGGSGYFSYDFGGGQNQSRALDIQQDDKILLAGESFNPVNSNMDMVLVRLTSDGFLDSSFGNSGVISHFDATGDINNLIITATLVQPDGKVLVSGLISGAADNDMVIWRFDSSGVLDTGFGNNSGLMIFDGGYGNDVAASMAIQPDGKILAAGFTVVGPGAMDVGILRLLTDGTVDTTFNGGLVTLDGPDARGDNATGIFLQDDGKVIATGYTSRTSGDTEMAIWRIE